MAKVTKPRVERTRPGELVALAHMGRIRIPRFQRSFRWQTTDVVRLFDSLLRGYPIGNLLMWRRPAPAGTVEIGPLVVHAPEVPDALWVVRRPTAYYKHRGGIGCATRYDGPEVPDLFRPACAKIRLR